MHKQSQYLEVGKMDYLFERFYKGKNDSNGHGIGLSVAASIVQAHKGKIQASSEDGKTITFVATI